MADRKELVAAKEAALKELKRTDAIYHKTEAAREDADEKRVAAIEAANKKYSVADAAHDEASEEWDAAETEWQGAVRTLAEYDIAHAEEFV